MTGTDQDARRRTPNGPARRRSSTRRVLILHASVGSGHEYAGRALQGAFERLRNFEVQLHDALAFSAPVFRRAYAQSYLDTTARAPGLWRHYFEGTDLREPKRVAADNRARGRLEKPLLGRLDHLVTRFAPCAILCTHFLPAEVLVRRHAHHAANPPIYTVVTDHVVHSFWQTPGITGYFVASDIARDQLIARGVSPQAIRVRGIPVAPGVAVTKEASDVRERHGWSVDRPLIALLGGGLPRDHVRRMVTDLRVLERPLTLVVVAGRNATLPHVLADLTSTANVNLQVLHAIDYVDDLVAASDLVVTKSGGLIVSEVLARGTPLLVVDPIPGQEEWNADYVTGAGAGLQLRRPEMVADVVHRLLSEPGRLAAMRERARQAGRPRAALDIAADVCGDLGLGRTHLRSLAAGTAA